MLADSLCHFSVHAECGCGSGGDDARGFAWIGSSIGLRELECREVLGGFVGCERMMVGLEELTVSSELE